ncbi:MAG: cbb3-type cytochrome c oxidase subunit I, partial [Parachlamydia sp.]|nr:cbb3-type cytochrome c oxidase subunit I [Parachlamydia sp.]
MFGRLTVEAFKHEGSQDFAVLLSLITGAFLIGLITYLKRWKWLWSDWLTTVDHKKIGILYMVVVLMMFLKGLTDALMMRLQQALAVGDAQGFISPGHFQEIFSAHGTTMIFFVAMGFVFSLANLI